MKKYRLFLFLAVAFILTSINVYATRNTLSLVGVTIAIDIGHGGKDPGTIFQDVLEKDINLSIGLKIKYALIKEGANVVVTREGDYDLSSPNAARRKKSDFDNRIELINSSQAAIYISIHQNFLEQRQYSGPQVFYDPVNDKNIEIAKIIQTSLNKEIKGTRSIKRNLSTMYLYKKINVPGVLIECGFISNYKDRKRLQQDEYQNKLVNAIVKGIIESL